MHQCTKHYSLKTGLVSASGLNYIIGIIMETAITKYISIRSNTEASFHRHSTKNNTNWRNEAQYKIIICIYPQYPDDQRCRREWWIWERLVERFPCTSWYPVFIALKSTKTTKYWVNQNNNVPITTFCCTCRPSTFCCSLFHLPTEACTACH